ncbi:MAG: proton-conducting membrane transporter [Lachnospiraceae bacterium]|nr:proton-conducting membrane transporter [Lachnospiraceae bacterium]
MNRYLPLIVVIIPILGSLIIPLIDNEHRKLRCIYIESLVLINTILVFLALINNTGEICEFIRFTGNLSISFRIDGLSVVFSALVAFLWPLATLYSFEYMTKEKHEKIFFMFYTMTYGVTLGIAMAEDFVSLYCFYELLTLVTVPLVIHSFSREAILAARKYLYYSLGGAAFAFIGMIFIITYSTTNEFTYGGVLDMAKVGDRANILLLIYVLTFMGFSVKAAMFPFSGWLPQAGVAPTPVTALLHAVAVVKSGAFAIMRITYYSFGADFVRGTWAQNIVMLFTVFTIVYGCSKALKETHLKRRLAYSTISNLSYILFGVTLMTPLGLVGALSHLVFHAFMKISSFFCAGAIMHQTEKHYIHELDGLGRRMPITFCIFTVSSLALMGVPGLAGFVSKWNLATAAAQSNNRLGYIGIGALLISALLTAIYMMSIVMRAFEPGNDFNDEKISQYKDPNILMILPLVIFTIVVIIFGLHSQPFVEYFRQIAGL